MSGFDQARFVSVVEVAEMAQVTVIVVSYNSQSHLATCLDSVMGQDTPTHIVVVDNGSTDASVDNVQTGFPTARLVINERNRGFAAAVNQGLALAKGNFVLLLNPDAVLLPGALSRLAESLKKQPRAAAAGPRQWLDKDCNWQLNIVPYPPHWPMLLSRLPYIHRLGLVKRRLSPLWQLNRAIWHDDRPQIVPYLSGACILLRRSALEAIGGLDENYFLFFEDIDLCDRLRAADWTLYAVPSSGIIHATQGSVHAMPDGGRRHLLASGQRYLAQYGNLLTRTLWSLLQTRHSTKSLNQNVTNALSLHWSPIQNATVYWVELAIEPSFLYAATTKVSRPTCTLASGLAFQMQKRPFFWRVAAKDAQGQLGEFTLNYYKPEIPD